MKKNPFVLFILAPLGIALFVAVGGWIVMWLWNSLLPVLFGLPTITFWQALGLLVLSRILFGSFGPHRIPARHKIRHRLEERLEHMSPEDRERIRQALKRAKPDQEEQQA